MKATSSECATTSCASPINERTRRAGRAIAFAGSSVVHTGAASAAVVTSVATLLLTVSALAAPPPWLPGEAHALYADARSVELIADDEPLFLRPLVEKKRRGAARIGARLPLFGATRGPGCTGFWLWVGPSAWLCDERVRASNWPAEASNVQTHFSDGLPFRYHFVGRDGAFAYSSLLSADDAVPTAQLEPGFSVALSRVEAKPNSTDVYGLTSHALWVPVRDLIPASGSLFRGVQVENGELDAAWVVTDTAPVELPRGLRSSRVIPALSEVKVLEERTKGARSFARISASDWVPLDVVRRASLSEAPADLAEGERWIAVNLESQTLVAYEGSRAVFTTLVATGRGAAGSEQATPVGDFRVWVKLLSSDMTNLEETEASSYYAIESVPWVMFFQAGYGLHGAFWHSAFGHRRSHGCVNLAPLDAQWLFAWTAPRMPSGWRAALPTAHEQGTRVVIR